MAKSTIPQDGNLNNSLSPNSNPDSHNLPQQIAQAQAEVQARIDAVGKLIDAALGVMARLIDELAVLREGR